MAQTVAWSDRVTLPPIGASAAVARGFVDDLLLEHDLLYLVQDVRSVVSELATDACRHASTSFSVLLEGLSDSVRLTVSDDSKVRPALAAPSTTASAGRGLNVVDDHSTDWGLRPGNRNATSVWVSFSLRPRIDDTARTEPEALVPTVSGHPSLLLSALLRDVQQARADLREARAGGRAEIMGGAHARLVDSLKQYVEALASGRLPVPYLLRDELRLYSETLCVYRGSRRGAL